MKVLIISHLPMATQNNMGKTFLSLFSRFDKDELCQFYIYPSYPDVDGCSSYYRVTDKEILASLVKFGSAGKEVASELITETQGLYENEGDEAIYRNKKNKSAARRLARDAMWKVSRWYNKSLKAWLEKEKPTCIFVAPGAAMFIYDVALKISKKRGIPIVSYICDEYYFVKPKSSLLEKLRQKLLQKKIEKLVNKSCSLAVICREIKEAYEEKFGTKALVLHTGASIEFAKAPKAYDHATEISYFGNIRGNRFISLAEIGKELDEINRELGTDYKLKIYTSEKDGGILSTFKGIDSTELCGFLTGEAYSRAFSSAQLLLHCEAFDEESIDLVKHSVSTKIADSLASGIPLVAFGPECIASIKHLADNDCALLATDKKDLRQTLLKAFCDEEAKKKAVMNALKAAREYHDSRVTSDKLKDILETISG